MRIGTVDTRQLRGVNDKVLGLSKEVVGVLVGNDTLQHQGDLQQQQGKQRLDALREQISAEKAQIEARILERRQKAAEHRKAT